MRVTAAGITADADRVKGIRELARPTNAHDLMRLMGLAQFYAKLIPRFAQLFHGLQAILAKAAAAYAAKRQADKKPLRAKPAAKAPKASNEKMEPSTIPPPSQDDPFLVQDAAVLPIKATPMRADRGYINFMHAYVIDWTDELNKEFTTLIDRLCNPECHAMYRPGYPLRLETDASVKGLSAILTQAQLDGSWRTLTAYSRKLTTSEEKLPANALEARAIVFGLLKNRDILEDINFTLVTDHQSLRQIMDYPGIDRKMQRIADEIKLWTPRMHIVYRPGPQNVIADTLSRLPTAEARPEELQDFASVKIPDLPAVPTNTQWCRRRAWHAHVRPCRAPRNQQWPR